MKKVSAIGQLNLLGNISVIAQATNSVFPHCTRDVILYRNKRGINVASCHSSLRMIHACHIVWVVLTIRTRSGAIMHLWVHRYTFPVRSCAFSCIQLVSPCLYTRDRIRLS